MRLSQAELELGEKLSFSSTATALQVEHIAEAQLPDFRQLQAQLAASAATAYLNARRWMTENELDSVFIFNGRFDLTRAIVAACEAESVRFVSVERSWFGAGLQLLPQENCNGLRNLHAMAQRWSSKPLTFSQATRASELILKRLSRTSVGEWRQYNVNNSATVSMDRIKYLYLPSSQHEWLGHPDRTGTWQHPTEGLEYLFSRLGVSMKDLVVRGHPGWALKIKRYGANRANNFYKDWTKRVGASWLGKSIVCLVPAAFTSSGISINLFGPADIDRLSESTLASLSNPDRQFADHLAQCQRGLRFIYCANFRLMQFADSVIATSPFRFSASDPTDLSRLDALARDGILQEADATCALDDRDERRVAESIVTGDAAEMPLTPEQEFTGKPVVRRAGYRVIDLLTP
jgi:hypothetical protein